MSVQNGTDARVGWRELTLAALLAAPLAIVFVAVPPIAQDPGYHALADGRSLWSVPNVANVASNALFLIVGVLGLHLCLIRGRAGPSVSWVAFFIGTGSVAAGSAYYHWSPTDATLTWDRLPMTIVVMALFSALLAEHVRAALERVVLPACLAIGVASIAWWRYADDLRLYGWVQFAPLLAIAFLLAAYRGRYTHRSALVWALVLYGLAKIAEQFDGPIFEWSSQAISGHTVKHVLAALALYAIYWMLKARRRLGA